MTDSPTDHPFDRRLLLRGGAIAAGVAAAAAVVTPTPARAADGDKLQLGAANVATTTTSLSIGGANAPGSPTLQLSNPAGPSLLLGPTRESLVPDDLAVGAIMATPSGPYVGSDYGNGPETTYLATADDLTSLPTPLALSPTRLLDTRRTGGRANIVRRQDGALDAGGRLVGGRWIDIWVFPYDDGSADAAFLNVTALSPTGNGYLFVYPPTDPRPVGSTLNYRKGVATANAAFVQTLLVGTDFLVRIFASATTHVLLDRTGVVVTAPAGGPASESTGRRAVQRRRIERMRAAASAHRRR